MADPNMSYTEALHAMQTGVLYDQDRQEQVKTPATLPRDASPKHVRVGINSMLVNQAAVVRLLIDRKLFTEAEYMEAVRQEMIREVERYEESILHKYMVKVTLR